MPIARISGMSTARAFAFVASLALFVGGCGFGDGFGGSGDSDEGTHYSGPTGGGKLLIAWTLDGAPPSDATCAAIDHLVLGLDYDDGSRVAISPIPCSLTRFRYDGLPAGHATLSLGAYDSTERCLLAQARAPLTLSTILPDAPAPVLALPAPRVCR